MSQSLSLEEQVAQRFIVGFSGETPSWLLQQWIAQGLGGLIFFRDNFQDPSTGVCTSPSEIAHTLWSFQQQRPKECPPLFLSIDQEGGQIERLSHRVFPTTLNPMAIGHSPQPTTLAQRVYTTMAQGLSQLGFNLVYFPTLDVHLQPANPVIGVRSFGSDPQGVWNGAEEAIRAYHQHGVLTVGKHFPGHGNGTVDSHETLPILEFTELELWPFQQAIEGELPAMMVSHGFYPTLQVDSAEQGQPASLSSAIIQNLLRERCGFQGLVITDDLCMGAITEQEDPVEVAFKAIQAGADILLYRQSTDLEWQVYEAIVKGLQTGKLSQAAHQESVARILQAKKRLPSVSTIPPMWSSSQQEAWQEWVEAETTTLAQQALLEQVGTSSRFLPVDSDTQVWLIHPHREAIPAYRWDTLTSPELPQLFQAAGYQNIVDYRYTPGTFIDLETLVDSDRSPDRCIFVTWNPLRFPEQIEAVRWLKEHYPEVPLLVVDAGTPNNVDVFAQADIRLTLGSYRPASLQALVSLLL